MAVKKVKSLVEDDSDLKYVLREVSILDTIRHPNIVHIYNISCNNLDTFDPIFIVMERCTKDLKSILKSQLYFDHE